MIQAEGEDILNDFIIHARSGETEEMKSILSGSDEKRRLITTFNSSDQQSIFFVCANNHCTALELLLQSIEKEDLLLTNKQGNTCLHWACLNGHLEIVRLLISFTNNLALVRNNNGLSAATLAESRGYMDIVQLIISSYDPEDGVDDDDIVVSNTDKEYQSSIN